MAGAVCSRLIRGKVGRFTKVDQCGAVLPGPLNEVVTEGLISVTITPTNFTGTAIQLPNANGDLWIDDTPIPRFQYMTNSIAFVGVDPILIAMVANQETYEGVVAGEVTGFTIGDDVDPEAAGFSTELWSGTAGTVCTDGARRYGYFLEPWLLGGAVDAITWANDAINFTVAGARTMAPNQWGVGLHDVTLDDAGDPAPLRVALGERKHFLFDQVLLAPPVGDCGGNPVGAKVTGATAGTPGTFTPNDGSHWIPMNLADLAGVTASPSTAWTTGQRVVLQDGTSAHWSSTAWVAGPA